VEEWARATPDGFSFTLKTPRRITHDARLHGVEEILDVFASRARLLGPKLGTLLVQLPPSFLKNLERIVNIVMGVRI